MLEGAAALVTGAAKRIGRAIALDLAAHGCDVAVHYHTSSEDAASLRDQIRSTGRRCEALRADLSDPALWPRLIDDVVGALGRLDILINNASAFEKTPQQPFDAAHWERTFRLNVTAPAALVHHAVPFLRRGGRGKIVNLTDISAERPWRRHAAYCASKAALVNVTRSLAKLLAPDIQVNAVSPGIAVFPDHYDETTRQKLIAAVPLCRAGTPEEVAAVVRFLCDEGHYITGQTITVDGGRSIC
ncbi:MAG: SDR family oxidoreductase [Phycisphaerales bacterium]|nr:SDR family oxidoreductase [Phycisphaerales bacterium]